MALATTMQRPFASSNASIRRQSTAPRSSRAIAVAPRSRGSIIPQATFYLRPYGRGSCRSSSYYRPVPASVVLSNGLGLLNSMLASDWLREATSSVHPVDIKTFDDHYEINSDCPGMAEEDVEVEVSPDRVLTIAGSRKTPKRPTPGAKPSSGAPTPSPSSTPTADPPETLTRDGTTTAAATSAASAAGREDPTTQSEEATPESSSAFSVNYRFRRSFVLPEDAEVEGVEARLERGVLTVTVPRRVVEMPRPRRVGVKGGSK